jgi:hypothetical protein
MKALNTARIYLKRFFWYYLFIALAFSVMTSGFARLLQDSIKQFAVINFLNHFSYDLIVPKGSSLESLLFLQDIKENQLEAYIPANLYNTLKENSQIRLIPLLKDSTNGNQITFATDISEEDFNNKLSFFKRPDINFKIIPLTASQVSDPLWGKAIVNIIFVQGPKSVRDQLQDLVQKKTVAEYVAVGEKAEQLMKLLGWTEQKILTSWLVFVSVFISILFSIVLAVRPIWNEISLVLKRYERPTIQILMPLLLPLTALYAFFLILISLV